MTFVSKMHTDPSIGSILALCLGIILSLLGGAFWISAYLTAAQAIKDESEDIRSREIIAGLVFVFLDFLFLFSVFTAAEALRNRWDGDPLIRRFVILGAGCIATGIVAFILGSFFP